MGIQEAVLETLETFRRIGIEPLIGGSFASGAWGQPRQTNDIDLSAKLLPRHEAIVAEAFGSRYAYGPSELNWALTSDEPGRMFSLTLMDDPFKVDVFIMGNSEYENSELERATKQELFPGVEGLVIAPENIVLQKLRWYELGNRVSDRQWNDLVQVIEIQGDAFDREYLLTWAEHFDLKALAEEALSEARP